MIMPYQRIIYEWRSKSIGIEPFTEKNLGPASYDLTLGNTFVEPTPSLSSTFCDHKFTHDGFDIDFFTSTYPCVQTEVKDGSFYVIPPKRFVLATTKEHIHIPDWIAAYIEGRSSVGRKGLQVQNAGFVDPGFEGNITLELFNASDVPIGLMPGRRICQAVFFQLTERTIKPYRGKYLHQEGATASRIEEDYEVEDE